METTRNMKSLIEEAKAENKRLWKDVQVYAGIAGLDPIIVDHCVNVCAELSLDANQLAEKLNDGYPGFDPDKNHEKLVRILSEVAKDKFCMDFDCCNILECLANKNPQRYEQLRELTKQALMDSFDLSLDIEKIKETSTFQPRFLPKADYEFLNEQNDDLEYVIDFYSAATGIKPEVIECNIVTCEDWGLDLANMIAECRDRVLYYSIDDRNILPAKVVSELFVDKFNRDFERKIGVDDFFEVVESRTIGFSISTNKEHRDLLRQLAKEDPKVFDALEPNTRLYLENYFGLKEILRDLQGKGHSRR